MNTIASDKITIILFYMVIYIVFPIHLRGLQLAETWINHTIASVETNSNKL